MARAPSGRNRDLGRQRLVEFRVAALGNHLQSAFSKALEVLGIPMGLKSRLVDVLFVNVKLAWIVSGALTYVHATTRFLTGRSLELS
jgi:hypothetical protein